MNYSISFIVAAYNCQQYIGRCIDSVLKQPFSNYELIIVDDGSTDGTAGICDLYKDHERIEVIHQNNCGHTSARKRGLKKAKGDYVFFLDADDWLSDKFLEKINDALNTVGNIPDIIAFNYNRISETGVCKKIHSDVQPGLYDKQMLVNNIYPFMLCDLRKQFYSFGLFPTLWSKVFKRNLIADVLDLLNEKVVLGEDAFCVYLSLIKSQRLLIIDENLYNYQINNQSLSRKYAKDNFEKLSVLCRLMDAEYPEELRSQVLCYKLSMFMGAITNETRGPKKSSEIIRELKNRCEQETFKDCIYNAKVIHMSFSRKAIWNMLKAKLYFPIVYIFRIFKI